MSNEKGSDEKEFDKEDWVSITQAGIMLGVRYLKARDLMTTGQLGEIHQTSSNRYYVRRKAVEECRASMKDSS